MYYAIVGALMFAFPLLSAAVEGSESGIPISVALIAKWFVFWAVGVRLLLAGLRQVFQPTYTARVILGLKHDESLLLVRELGFANLAIGAVGAGSLALPDWRWAGALAGAIFYGLAGINHVLLPHRGRLENVAMVSDLFVSAVLIGASAVQIS